MKVRPEELDLITIGLDEILSYIDFIEMIKSRMEDKSYLGDFSYDDLCNLIENGTKIYCLKYGRFIVASCMLIPATDKDMKKFGLDFDYHKVADLGPQAVFLDFRGNGIQKYMIKMLEDKAKSLGYEYLVTTIHPDNTYSSKNVVESNFKLKGTINLSRGLREIYYKEI